MSHQTSPNLNYVQLPAKPGQLKSSQDPPSGERVYAEALISVIEMLVPASNGAEQTYSNKIPAGKSIRPLTWS